MYKVYCDGVAIYDLFSPDLMLLEPTLELELNSPGTFEFTIPLDHPYYDLPQEMLSRVWVTKDDEEIFRGRVIEEEIDWYKRKKVYCEGELAFLNDSIQRPAEYHDMTVRDYFKTLIEEHNSQVEEDKQFEIGYVLVEDTNDSLYRYTNYNSTLTEMKEDLVDDLGGYIRVRNQNGHRYLDYINIEDYGARNDQAIRFGINLLDFSQTMDVSDIATVIIPLGERLEESPIEALDMRLTIESVNGGSDAIESEEAVQTYGRIVQTVIWDDVTVASNLLEKGKKYLSDYQWDPLVLEITPVDLHDSDPDTESFNLGDQLRVISAPHGLDRYFPLSAMTIHLDSLDQNVFTLGTEIQGKTLTSRVRSTTDSVKQVEEEITPTQVILNQAREQATNLITAATHGHVVMQPNDKPEELLIMDTDDITTATNVWRWNMGGLGFSSTGYNGDYGHAAITMDGMINADYILTGELTANIIKTGKIQDVPGNNSWDMDKGTLTISTKQFTLDSSGNAKFSGNLSAVQGSFTSLYTGSHSSFSSTASGFYAGDSGLSLGQYFSVTSSGVLTSKSGTIGGWTIGSNYLAYNLTSTTVTNGMDSGAFIGREGVLFTYKHTSTSSLPPYFVRIDPKDYYEDGILQIFYDPDYIRIGCLDGIRIESRSGTSYSYFDRTTINFYYSSDTVFWLNSVSREMELHGTFYLNGSQITGSDERLKDNITTLGATNRDYGEIFDALMPVTFKYKSGGKEHIGFTYQNVRKALEAGGINPDESAMVDIMRGNDDSEEYGGIEYNDIIALLVYEVQQLKEQLKGDQEK